MPTILRFVLAVCTVTTLHFSATSQSLGVNTTGNPAHATAILDVESSSKGVLVPRMTKAQKNAIASPANALLVYQSGPDSIGFHYYDLPTTSWVYLNPSGFATDSTAWKTAGNTGLVDSSSFFGNIDNVPLNFRQNNVKAGRVDNIRGNVFFGNQAGNDTATGYVNIGTLAGSMVNNSFSGVNIGSSAGRYTSAVQPRWWRKRSAGPAGIQE
jgi:trimeric autotransporter adhesin